MIFFSETLPALALKADFRAGFFFKRRIVLTAEFGRGEMKFLLQDNSCKVYKERKNLTCPHT